MSQNLTPPSVAPNRLNSILGCMTVDVNELEMLTREEINAIRPHVNDQFLIALEPGHLRRFMAVVHLPKYRLKIINRARLLIRGGADIDLDTLVEATRHGRCGTLHKTVTGSMAHNCVTFYDQVSYSICSVPNN